MMYHVYRLEWELTGLPVCLMSGVLGPLRLTLVEQIALVNIYIPWAKENGKDNNNLITFYYEKNLHRDIDDIRKQLNIKAAPVWRY